MIPALTAALLLHALPCSDLSSWSKPGAHDRAAIEATFGQFPEDPTRLDEQALQKKLEALCALEAHPARIAKLTPHEGPTIASMLARPEFAKRKSHVSPFAEAIDRFLHWLSLLLGTSAAVGYAHVTRVLVLGLAALIAAYGAYRVFRRRYVRDARPPEPTGPAPLELESPTLHLDRARQALSTSPREALRQGLFALLSILERQSWARPDRVKTNRELAQELAQRGAPEPIRAHVTPLLATYDAAFYSLQPINPDAVSRFLDEVGKLQTDAEAAP